MCTFLPFLKPGTSVSARNFLIARWYALRTKVAGTVIVRRMCEFGSTSSPTVTESPACDGVLSANDVPVSPGRGSTTSTSGAGFACADNLQEDVRSLLGLNLLQRGGGNACAPRNTDICVKQPFCVVNNDLLMHR